MLRHTERLHGKGHPLVAAEVMTTDVLVVGADWSVDELAEFFIAKVISGAPVTTLDGELIGVVSMTDIVRNSSRGDKMDFGAGTDPHDYYVRGLELEIGQEEIKAYREGIEGFTSVLDIMTPMVFDVGEETPLRQVAETMVRGRIHRVFVTRDKKVVGVITALDMLRLLIEE